MENNEGLATKRCPRCGRVLTLDHFHKSGITKDGHTSYCKECAIECARESKNRLKENKPRLRYSRFSDNVDYLKLAEPRDLMLELARRGYEGVLFAYENAEKEIEYEGNVGTFKYVKKHEIDIAKLLKEE